MFTDRLRLTLSLTIGPVAFSFPAGSILRFDLDAKCYGFDAEVELVVSSAEGPDSLFAAFSSNDIIKATLSVLAHAADLDGDASPFVLAGYVFEKRLTEVVSYAVASAPIIDRLYTLRFSDAARAFWRQHFPLDLYVASSMTDVLEIHKTPGMILTYDWSRLDEKQAILCLGVAGDQRASFYDLLIWFIDDHYGVLEFDGTSTYRIAGLKSARQGDACPLVFESVSEIRILVPRTRRESVTVQNSFANGTQTTPISNADAVSGTRRDVFAYTFVSADVDRRVQVETDRLRPSEHHIEVTFGKCPDTIAAPCSFAALDDQFSENVVMHERNYRVLDVRMRGRAPGETDDANLEEATAVYEMDLASRMELESNPAPSLPTFQKPKYPILVEARTVSVSGEAEDRTWFAVSGDNDSLYVYWCNVPLWNKVIVVPFTPNRLPGHFFFPSYKSERVLVALYFDSAQVWSFLDWAANAKLSSDSQGNQIVMGNGASNGTILSHAYSDDQPTLVVKRTLGGDMQTLTISEGTIRIEVKEDPLVPEVVPRFDVTAQVEAAKAQVIAEVGGSITAVTGSFETSMGSVTTTLEGATAEVEAGLLAAESALVSRLEAAEITLKTLESSLSASVDAFAEKVLEAKAAIVAALMG